MKRKPVFSTKSEYKRLVTNHDDNMIEYSFLKVLIESLYYSSIADIAFLLKENNILVVLI